MRLIFFLLCLGTCAFSQTLEEEIATRSNLLRSGLGEKHPKIKALDAVIEVMKLGEGEQNSKETTKSFEKRGYIGLVIPRVPTQVSTGDFRTILNVMPKSPAADAGIKPGDYILFVDGQSTAGMKSYLELYHSLQGEPETEVILKLKRVDDDRIATFSIIRGEIMVAEDIPK